MGLQVWTGTMLSWVISFQVANCGPLSFHNHLRQSLIINLFLDIYLSSVCPSLSTYVCTYSYIYIYICICILLDLFL